MRWGSLWQRLLVFVVFVAGVFLFSHRYYASLSTATPRSSPAAALPSLGLGGDPPRQGRKALVVASLSGDDTRWLDQNFGSWETHVYTVNDAAASLTVPKNKGRESNVYLTYIIDNYVNLPEYMVFIHALRYQWHNEDPMYDGVPMLKNLRLSHIKDVGYSNLRCTWVLGCPEEVKPRLDSTPAEDEDYSRVRVEAAYADVFRRFFPDEPIPPTVGVHCGAQFALSRDKVLERPLSDYQMYRQWLWDTKLDDSVSGRVLEYMWHIIMGKPAVHCPDAGQCFCEKYNLCNLTCTQDHCEKRFQLPKYATFPQGWPEVGPGTDGWPEKGWWE